MATKRTELQQVIQDEISKDFEAQGLTLVQFLLRNISFSPEYATAVEQKQIAQQNAERAKFLVQQQEQEAARVRVEAQGIRDAAITRAEGESKALLLVADALRNNPDLIQYTYVQKIAPNISVIVLPGGGGGGGYCAVHPRPEATFGKHAQADCDCASDDNHPVTSQQVAGRRSLIRHRATLRPATRPLDTACQLTYNQVENSDVAVVGNGISGLL